MLTNRWRELTPGQSTEQDITAALGEAEREADGVQYGCLTGLHLLNYDQLRVSCFLQDQQLQLLAMRPERSGGFPVSAEEWQEALGLPAEQWPSTQGADHYVQVYSDRGLTATVADRRVALVEVFRPMSTAEYRRTLYKVPPEFIL